MSDTSDRVLGTPPTNTSEHNAALPFANLVAAVSPQWGETILRLTQATDRLATRFDQFIGAETQASTVQACRELAEELIAFLDGLEDTDQDAAVDDEPCDGDADAEHSLGSFDGMTNQAKAWAGETDRSSGDCEHDESDDEPSLGWTFSGQCAGSDDLEDQCDDEGDRSDSGIADSDGLMEQVGSPAGECYRYGEVL